MQGGKMKQNHDDRRADLICAGMALVDSLIRGFDPTPVSASGYRAESAALNVGGEAVNAAIAGAKLGMKTGIVCALGSDAAGDLVRAALERAGVDLEHIAAGPETPVTTLFIREDGSRRSVTNRSHRYNFHPEKDPAAFTGAKALLIGSLFRPPFDDPGIVYSVLKAAKEAGQIVIADTKLPYDWALKAEDLRDSFPMIDYLTPNEDEARYLTGAEGPENMADALLALGAGNVIVKLGGGGVCMKSRGKAVRLPAYAVRAVDSTGAGDNLAAGFVSEILRGKSPEEALSFANACGAVCVTALGAGTALKSREQVLRFMEETPLKTDDVPDRPD